MIRTKSNNRQRGFTLVEVIVVAVIVAAMAAVAVPVYLSYVSNSQLNAATNAAGSAASFLGACGNGGGGFDGDLPTPGEIMGGEGVAVDCVAGTGDGTSLNVPTDITLEREDNMVRGMHGADGMWSVWYSF